MLVPGDVTFFDESGMEDRQSITFLDDSRCKIHQASRVASIPERRIPKLSLFEPSSECGIIANRISLAFLNASI